MTHYSKTEETYLHDTAVLREKGEYGLSRDVFSALQEVRDTLANKPRNFLSRLYDRLAGPRSNFPPYFVILNYNPNNPTHQMYVLPNQDRNPMRGREFNNLDLKQRINLGYEKETFLLDDEGRIMDVAPGIGVPGFNGNPNKNGIEVSNCLDGISVYTMDRENGVISRYQNGRLVFSTSPEELRRVKDSMPLQDVKAITPSMEHPSDMQSKLRYEPLEANRLEFILDCV